MIFKIIGSILIISACFLVGYLKSGALYKRRDFLKSFLVFLSLLETNLRYNNSDIFTLVTLSATKQDLKNFCFDNNKQKPFDEIWNERISELPKEFSLKKVDKDMLFEFGSELGKSDLDGQLKHIELYKAVFEKQLSDAEEAIAKKSKLYKTMGFFTGISIALMII